MAWRNSFDLNRQPSCDDPPGQGGKSQLKHSFTARKSLNTVEMRVMLVTLVTRLFVMYLVSCTVLSMTEM